MSKWDDLPGDVVEPFTELAGERPKKLCPSCGEEFTDACLQVRVVIYAAEDETTIHDWPGRIVGRAASEDGITTPYIRLDGAVPAIDREVILGSECWWVCERTWHAAHEETKK